MKTKVKQGKKDNIIDWNKVQLVQSTTNECVYMTTGIHRGGNFSAVRVHGTIHLIGEYSKEYVKLFTGKLTLKN